MYLHHPHRDFGGSVPPGVDLKTSTVDEIKIVIPTYATYNVNSPGISPTEKPAIDIISAAPSCCNISSTSNNTYIITKLEDERWEYLDVVEHPANRVVCTLVAVHSFSVGLFGIYKIVQSDFVNYMKESIRTGDAAAKRGLIKRLIIIIPELCASLARGIFIVGRNHSLTH